MPGAGAGRSGARTKLTCQPASGRPKAMMYILDRSIDPVGPFLHEFWYQAMVNDLLSVEEGVKYK